VQIYTSASGCKGIENIPGSLYKGVFGFVMTVCPSAGNNSLPPDGFSRNFIFKYFSKICRENPIFIKL
jgi:hypothetical protein